MIDPRKLKPEEIKFVADQLRNTNLARLLDSTLLAPEAPASAIDVLVDEAVNLGAHVCVNESRLERAVSRLESHKVARSRPTFTSTVIGFPLGACTTEIKVFSARCVLELGADEIDMVANTGLLKDGDKAGYKDDIEAVATVVSGFNQASGARRGLKVIIECCHLSNSEKEYAAATVADIGLKHRIPIFVKTSTGFGKPTAGKPAGATIDDVLLVRKTVGEYHPEDNPVGVKPAGGIKTAASAVGYVIAAGGVDSNLDLVGNPHFAVRIGTSSVSAIMRDFDEKFEDR